MHLKKCTHKNLYIITVTSMIVAYKLRWLSTVDWKYGREIKVKLVARFIDWKFDKFIPIEEAMLFLDKAVIYEDDFNSIMSKSDKKRMNKGLF